MLAHVIGVPLGLADVSHRRVLVLFFEAIVDAVLVFLDALGFLHAAQQRQCGFRAGLGLLFDVTWWRKANAANEPYRNEKQFVRIFPQWDNDFAQCNNQTQDFVSDADSKREILSVPI
jgi:hypothetical protein